MSYILDALNKSEEEKKQHRTPGRIRFIKNPPTAHRLNVSGQSLQAVS